MKKRFLLRDDVGSVAAVADVLGVNVESLLEAVETRQLKAARIGTHYVLRGAWVIDWLESTSGCARQGSAAVRASAYAAQIQSQSVIDDHDVTEDDSVRL